MRLEDASLGRCLVVAGAVDVRDGLLFDSLIVSCRPPRELPDNLATASSASSSDGMLTKAKPRGRLVAASVAIRTELTRPYCSNRNLKSASQAVYGKFPTKIWGIELF